MVRNEYSVLDKFFIPESGTALDYEYCKKKQT